MARDLKVFSTAAGFYRAIVAAPSQKAALAAWGVRDDLFAKGLASVVEEPELIAAAREKPGTILRAPLHDHAAFVAAAGKPELRRTDDPAPSTPPSRAVADRTALTAAETALASGRAEFDRRRDLLDARRAELEKEQLALMMQIDREIESLNTTLERERDAYQLARTGG